MRGLPPALLLPGLLLALVAPVRAQTARTGESAASVAASGPSAVETTDAASGAAPLLLAEDAAAAALRSDLDGLVRARSWGDSEWGVLVRSLDTGETLYSVDAERPLAPASNAKLLTTAAALHTLGPDFRFRTYLMTDGEVRNGVLEGDLILYGTGDPGISARFYRDRADALVRLIEQLEAMGIQAVRGDLVADASFFEGPLLPAGWDPRDLNDHFAAPISALSFNENVVSFRIVPREAGAAPDVQTIPGHAGLEVLNRAVSVAGTPRPRVAILRDHPTEPVRVEGEIRTGGADVWRQLTVPRPAHFAASVFRALLEARGITVDGGIRLVTEPDRSAVVALSAPFAGRRGPRILARHVSEPLQRYLEVINRESHNLFAEMVFRTLGRVATGQGSEPAGSAAVRWALEDMGLDVEGLHQVDGSGLSADNRVSASLLVSLLEIMSEGPLWTSYWATLPEAGRRDGLRRMYRTAAAGNLRAKTGTIEGVSALTGVVRAADGERLAFSILLNRTRSTVRAKAVENQIGARLASLRRDVLAPPSTELATFAEAASPAADTRHHVAPGENLTVIARRYGVSVDAMLLANPGLEPDRLRAGEWITVPATVAAATETAGGL